MHDKSTDWSCWIDDGGAPVFTGFSAKEKKTTQNGTLKNSKLHKTKWKTELIFMLEMSIFQLEWSQVDEYSWHFSVRWKIV